MYYTYLVIRKKIYRIPHSMRRVSIDRAISQHSHFILMPIGSIGYSLYKNMATGESLNFESLNGFLDWLEDLGYDYVDNFKINEFPGLHEILNIPQQPISQHEIFSSLIQTSRISTEIDFTIRGVS